MAATTWELSVDSCLYRHISMSLRATINKLSYFSFDTLNWYWDISASILMPEYVRID